jgi:uncharacterized protein (DUF427 family)
MATMAGQAAILAPRPDKGGSRSRDASNRLVRPRNQERLRASSGMKEVPSMNDRPVDLPGKHYPIKIEQNPEHVVVRVGGYVVAHSRHALTMREGYLDPVIYIPWKDVDFILVKGNDHQTYCSYKGDCSYYDIPLGGAKSVNAIWEYKDPYEAVAQIKGHVAFYPDRVDSIYYHRGRGNLVDPTSLIRIGAPSSATPTK